MPSSKLSLAKKEREKSLCLIRECSLRQPARSVNSYVKGTIQHNASINVSLVAMSPTAPVIVTASKQASFIQAWDISTREKLWQLKGHGIEAALTAMNFSPDGSLFVTGDSSGAVKIWHVESQSCLLSDRYHWQGYVTPICQVDVSPCLKYMIAAVGQKLCLWNLETGQMFRTFQMNDPTTTVADLPRNYLYCFGFAYDAHNFIMRVIGAGGVIAHRRMLLAPMFICNLEAENGMDLDHFYWRKNGHTDSIFTMATSRDGRRLVTGSIDNSAKIWDIATGRHLNTLYCHGKVCSVHFIKNDTMIVTTGCDKRLRLWNSETGHCTQTIITECDKSALSWDEKWLSLNYSPSLINSNFKGSDSEYVKLVDLGSLIYDKRWQLVFMRRLMMEKRARMLASGLENRPIRQAAILPIDFIFRHILMYV